MHARTPLGYWGPEPRTCASLFSTVESHAHPAPQGAQHGSGGRVLYPGSSEPGSRGIPAARLGGLFTQVPLSYRSPSPRTPELGVTWVPRPSSPASLSSLTPTPHVHGSTAPRTPGQRNGNIASPRQHRVEGQHYPHDSLEPGSGVKAYPFTRRSVRTTSPLRSSRSVRQRPSPAFSGQGMS